MAMSNFDIKVSLEETAKLAWETFGKAWSFDDGGIDKRWLYTVQQWPMPASGNPGKIAKRFLNELWSHMEKTYGVIKQPPRPTSARQANSWSSSRAVDGSHYQVLGLSPSECVTNLLRIWYQCCTHVLPIRYQSGTNLVRIWYHFGVHVYQCCTHMLYTNLVPI